MFSIILPGKISTIYASIISQRQIKFCYYCYHFSLLPVFADCRLLSVLLGYIKDWLTDLKFYSHGYWHYHSASVLPSECTFPYGDREPRRMFFSNYSCFRRTHVPQPGTPDPIYQGNKGPSVITLLPFASLLLPLPWCQQQTTLPFQCTGEQGTQLGAQQWQGRGSGGWGLKEMRTYGNMQETTKHTSCFQEAQQTGYMDSASLG